MANSKTAHGHQLQEQEPHIAVLAFPFSSHAGSLLSVICHLASAAPSTTLISFFNTRTSHHSLFIPTNNIPPNIKAHDVTDGVPKGYVFLGKPQEDIGLFMSVAPDSFRLGMKAAAVDYGRRITCVVADAFFWFAEEIAAEMQVPWIAFWTSGPSSLAAHLYTDLIREKLDVTKGIAGREDETLDFIPGMAKMQVKDLPEGVLLGNLESPFSRMLLLMGRALPRATAVALNSFEELDPALTQHLKSNISNFFSIGPLNLLTKTSPVPDEYNCLPWLDNRKASASVAYISFGSVAVPPRSELVAIAEALEATSVPFIWSLKRECWEHNLPKGFLERTRAQGVVVPWAPQVNILSHEAVGVFVTHCGWSSFMEGLAGGVPMICRPFFGDQRLNGRTIQDVLEIGVKLERGTITTEGLVRNLALILTGDLGRLMRDNAKHLRLQAWKALEESPMGSATYNFNELLKVITIQRCSEPPEMK